jgi:hypothetical protein
MEITVMIIELGKVSETTKGVPPGKSEFPLNRLPA